MLSQLRSLLCRQELTDVSLWGSIIPVTSQHGLLTWMKRDWWSRMMLAQRTMIHVMTNLGVKTPHLKANVASVMWCDTMWTGTSKVLKLLLFAFILSYAAWKLRVMLCFYSYKLISNYPSPVMNWQFVQGETRPRQVSAGIGSRPPSPCKGSGGLRMFDGHGWK